VSTGDERSLVPWARAVLINRRENEKLNKKRLILDIVVSSFGMFCALNAK